MSKIYIAKRDVEFLWGAIDTGYDHLYIVYDPDDTPTNNNELIIRGGPTPEVIPPDFNANPWTLEAIVVEVAVEVEESEDKLDGDTPEDRFYTELGLQGLETDNVWAFMRGHAQAIHDAALTYELEYDTGTFEVTGGQTSNSVIASVIMELFGLGSMVGYLPDDPGASYPGLADPLIEAPAAGYTVGGYTYKLGTFNDDTITSAGETADHVLDGGLGDDTLTGGAGDDNLYGGAGADTLHGDAGEDTIHGGLGTDTVNYSSGPNRVTVTLDDGGDGTATDGYGDTDTLSSIENIVGSSKSDEFYLTGPAGRVLDGGLGTDKVTYTGGVVFDRNTSQVWGKTGVSTDTLVSIESRSIAPSRILEAYKDTGAIGEGTVIHDYSAHNPGMSLNASITLTVGVNGNGSVYTPATYYEGLKDATGSITLSNGVVHNFDMQNATAFSEVGAGTLGYVISKLNQRDMQINFQGTNWGDTVTFTKGAFGYGGYGTLEQPIVRFYSGWGNDTITLDQMFVLENTVSGVTLEYRGGNDTVVHAGGLAGVILWEGILESEVTVTSGGGNTVIDAGVHGTLTLEGKDSVAPGFIQYRAASSNDVIYGTWGGFDQLTAHEGREETFYALGGGDSVFVNGGDTVYGGGGPDSITTTGASSDENYLFGGAGDDYYQLSPTAVAVINDGEGVNTIIIQEIDYADLDWAMVDGALELYDSSNGDFMFARIETPAAFSGLAITDFLSSTRDTLYSITDMLDGTATPLIVTNGADTVYGNVDFAKFNISLWGGDDVFHGSSGSDKAYGEAGNDTLYGGDGNDEFIADRVGDDALYGENGDDRLRVYIQNVGNDHHLFGGSGHDIYLIDNVNSFSTITDTITITDPDSSGTIYFFVDPAELTTAVNGTDLEFYYAGSLTPFVIVEDASQMAGTVVSVWTEGTDVHLTTIADILTSNGYYSYEINETLNLDLSSGAAPIISPVLDTGADADYLNDYRLGFGLTTFNDVVTGSVFQDTIFADGGNDTISGNDGDDILHGDQGADTIHGDDGEDTIDGGTGDDTLYGDDDDDSIEGGGGSDHLLGGNGNDTLKGGYGIDILEGGAGDDTYVVGPGDEYDRIIDTQGTNKLKVLGNLQLSDLRFVQVGDDLIVDIGSGVVLEDFFAASNASAVRDLVFESAPSTLIDLDTVSLTANLNPVGEADSFSVDRHDVVTGNVLADNGNGVDQDPDGNAIAVQSGSFMSAAGATVEIEENGDFTYRAPIGFIGADSFTYTLTDGRGGSAVETVSITVSSITGDTVGTSGNNTLNGNSSANTLFGLGGNDSIDGAAGDDALFGGGGNDNLVGGHGSGQFYGQKSAGDYRCLRLRRPLARRRFQQRVQRDIGTDGLQPHWE
jgi:Ca2+-binding RTX toxin-like protein